MKQRKTNADIMQIVTDKLVAQIEKSGKLPWQKPWKTSATTLKSGRVINPNEPMNYVSKRNYRGINFWLLQCNDFESNYWVSFKQMVDLGGKLKAEQKATTVVYWDVKEYEQKNEETGEKEMKKFYFLKYSNVFNFDQIDFEVQPKEIKADIVTEEIKEIEPIEALEQLIGNIPNCSAISHDGGNRAYYRPSNDSIHMPNRNHFRTTEGYYSTLVHEIAHSTGHQSRLNRETLTTSTMFGSDVYSREELVAELTASFVLGITGFSTEATEKNSAAYLQSWCNALKSDTKMIFWASTEAQKATEYILNEKSPE